jgi:hypothetical protein
MSVYSCQISGSHSGTEEDSRLLGHDALLVVTGIFEEPVPYIFRV